MRLSENMKKIRDATLAVRRHLDLIERMAEAMEDFGEHGDRIVIGTMRDISWEIDPDLNALNQLLGSEYAVAKEREDYPCRALQTTTP